MDEHDILLVAGGDSEAFERIVKRNQSEVTNWFRKRTRNLADAQDLAQEVFIRVFTGKYRSDNFRGWLFKIASRVLIDAWRMSDRRVQTVSDDESVWDARGGVDPAVVAEERDCLLVIRESMEHLPEVQREALESSLEGWTTIEIAQIMECGIPTAKSRVRLARERIRQSVCARR